MYKYKANLVRVIDGDTIDVMIDLGFGTWKKGRLRLFGIDAPETRTKDLEEKARGIRAKIFVIGELSGCDLFIETKKRKGKFGRYLADVYYQSKNMAAPVFLNQKMIELGLVKEYLGGAR